MGPLYPISSLIFPASSGHLEFTIVLGAHIHHIPPSHQTTPVMKIKSMDTNLSENDTYILQGKPPKLTCFLGKAIIHHQIVFFPPKLSDKPNDNFIIYYILCIIIINYYYYSMGLCNQHPFFRALFGRGQSPLLFHIHHGDFENGGHAAAAALHVTQKTPMPSQVFGQHDGSLQRV